MKIAITSKGKDLDSAVDPRFGRAAFILIVDPESTEIEVWDNSVNREAFKGAGIQAAARVGESGAEALLTGFCGPNAFRVLSAAGVKVASNVSGTVREAVKAYVAGSVSFAEEPNADGHW